MLTPLNQIYHTNLFMKKKQKILILTLNDLNNYGNRLQNFALQYSIKKFGGDPRTLWHSYFDNNVQFFRSFLKEAYFDVQMAITPFRPESKARFKRLLFNRLIKKEKAFCRQRLNRLVRRYKKVIVGSDQIWNFNFIGPQWSLCNDRCFDGLKRYSYAGSCGSKMQGNANLSALFLGLDNFENQSFREISAYNEYLSEHSGKECSLNVDPTLLLSKREWETAFSLEMSNLKSQSCFIYVLGKIDTKIKKVIDDKVEGCFSNLCWHDDIFKGSEGCQTAKEFLNQIRQAETIVTNSFHASVFSALFQKKLILINSSDTLDDRFKTLFYWFGIAPLQNQKIIEIDFSDIDVDSTIAEARNAGLSLIKNIVEDR